MVSDQVSQPFPRLLMENRFFLPTISTSRQPTTSSRNYVSVREGISQDCSDIASEADTKILLGMSRAELTPLARDDAVLATHQGKIQLVTSHGKNPSD